MSAESSNLKAPPTEFTVEQATQMASSVDKSRGKGMNSQTFEYRGQNFNFQFASSDGHGEAIHHSEGVNGGIFDHGTPFENPLFHNNASEKNVSSYSFSSDQVEYSSGRNVELIDRSSAFSIVKMDRSKNQEQQTSNVIVFMPSDPQNRSQPDGVAFPRSTFCNQNPSNVESSTEGTSEMKSTSSVGRESNERQSGFALINKESEIHDRKSIIEEDANIEGLKSSESFSVEDFLRENISPEAQESVKDELKVLPTPPSVPLLSHPPLLDITLRRRLEKEMKSRQEKLLTSSLLTIFFDDRTSSYQRELTCLLKPVVKMLELLESSQIDIETLRRLLGSVVALIASLQAVIVADRRKSIMKHYGLTEDLPVDHDQVEVGNLFGEMFLSRHGFIQRKDNVVKVCKPRGPSTIKQTSSVKRKTTMKRKRNDKRTQNVSAVERGIDEIAQIIVLDNSLDQLSQCQENQMKKIAKQSNPENWKSSAETQEQQDSNICKKQMNQRKQTGCSTLLKDTQEKPKDLPCEQFDDLDDIGQPVSSPDQSISIEHFGSITAMDRDCTNDEVIQGNSSLVASKNLHEKVTTGEGVPKQNVDVCTEAEESVRSEQSTRQLSTASPRIDNPPVTCTLCEQSFGRRVQLVQHLKQSHVDQLPRCDVCSRRFAFESTLKRHKDKKHAGDESGQREKCPHCGKTFPDSDRLQAHLFVHTGTKQFCCSICARRCLTKAHLDQHMAAHRRDEERYYCEQCDKRFVKKTNYRHHLRLHSGEKNFECEVCHKKFATRQYLHIHLRSHSAEKLFTCDICGRGFQFRHVLVDHVRTHTGETPFVCEICGISFKVQRTLKRHMKTHGDDRPHTCHICQRGFKVKATLREHMKTHSNEKPYQCHECGLAYKRNVELRKHACLSRQNAQVSPPLMMPTPRLQTTLQLAPIGGQPSSCSLPSTSVSHNLLGGVAPTTGVGNLVVPTSCEVPVQVQLEDVTGLQIAEAHPGTLQVVIPVGTVQAGPDGTTTTIILQPMTTTPAGTANGNFAGIHFINL